MGTLTSILQFLLSLAILITLHELGHFLAARMFGIRVEKFYLFFDAWGVKLFKFKKGDTEYGIGWLPLGGYVKIAGMVDESLDTEQMKSEPQSWEFRSKPAWQRLIVMIGGVTVNLILGILIMIMIKWNVGEKYVPNTVINESGGIYASPVARTVGLQTGDKIISLNGKPVENLESEFLHPDFIMADKKEVALNRGGKDTTIVLSGNLLEKLGEKTKYPFISAPFDIRVKKVISGTPASKAGLKEGDQIVSINNKPCTIFFDFQEKLEKLKDSSITLGLLSAGNQPREIKLTVSKEGTIGFQPDFEVFEKKSKEIKLSLGESIVKGTKGSFELLATNVKGLGKVITGQVDPKKSLAGPVRMAQMYGSTWNWLNFWSLTAMISLVLAFMNILPIPALDGGHVMFLLWEIITRRPVTEKVLYIGQVIGMILLAALMIFVFWVDIAAALGF